MMPTEPSDPREPAPLARTSGTQNLPPETDPVELPGEFPTPVQRQLTRGSVTGPLPSAEPQMNISSPDAAEASRRLAEHAVIARGLFLNWTNREVVEELAKVNRRISERTLQRIVKTPEFQDYYHRYRASMLGGVDDQVRTLFRQAGPEAAAKVIHLMRKADSERIQLDSAVQVLEMGNHVPRRGDDKRPPINITLEAVRELVTAGRRVVDIAALPNGDSK